MPETNENNSNVEPPKKVGRPKKKDGTKAGRVFRQTTKIFHDLFKLFPSDCKKNVSWEKDVVNLKDVTHQHFFHTYDSSGKKQVASTPTAGHFHLVETEDQGEGNPPKIISVSGPMVWGSVKDKRTGRRVRKALPYGQWDDYDPGLQDNHSHEIEYLESSEVNVRQLNSEAIKTVGKVESTTAKPGWIK